MARAGVRGCWGAVAYGRRRSRRRTAAGSALTADTVRAPQPLIPPTAVPATAPAADDTVPAAAETAPVAEFTAEFTAAAA